MTLALWMIGAKEKLKLKPWIQKLRSGNITDEMNIFAPIRGPVAQTELSLVDKIELARNLPAPDRHAEAMINLF